MELKLIKTLPSVICIIVNISIILYVSLNVDYKSEFEKFVEWARERPDVAVVGLYLFYVVTIILSMPILHANMAVSYIYCHVFKSFWTGILVAIPMLLVFFLTTGFLIFMISKYIFRDCIKKLAFKSKWIKRNFRACDILVTEKGKSTACLVRLTPLPFGVGSYIFGITSIKLSDFMIGSLGVLRAICTTTYIGATIYEVEITTKKKMDATETKEFLINFIA